MAVWIRLPSTVNDAFRVIRSHPCSYYANSQVYSGDGIVAGVSLAFFSRGSLVMNFSPFSTNWSRRSFLKAGIPASALPGISPPPPRDLRKGLLSPLPHVHDL